VLYQLIIFVGSAVCTNLLDLDRRFVSISWVWQKFALRVMEVCTNMQIAYIAGECRNRSVFEGINIEIAFVYLYSNSLL
jgi:hypothetical protein